MSTASLAAVLGQYVDLYERLLALAKRKQQLLVDGDTSALGPIIQVEEQLLQKLAVLDSERVSAVAALAGSEDGSITLGQLLPGLPASDQEVISRRKERLVHLLDELRRVGSENSLLLNQALQVVQFTIRLFEKPPATAVYSASGALVNSRQLSVVDRRA